MIDVPEESRKVVISLRKRARVLATGFFDLAWGVYDRLVLHRPSLSLLALAGLLAFFAWFIKDFRLDASADTLVLEQDDDVRYFRAMSDRYESGDFAVITYTPPEDLFSRSSLERLKRVREDLRRLERASSVVTLLDVPLLKNPPGTLKDLRRNIKTLESPKADVGMAMEELRSSPIYQNLVVSGDLRSTAIMVNFRIEKSDKELVARRALLREKDYRKTITQVEREELAGLEAAYRRYKDQVRAQRHEDIAAIRGIIRAYSSEARFFLGGLPMIVDDMMAFVQSDLRGFGFGMLVFLVLTLYAIYRRPLWVLLPVFSCAVSVVFMIGGLGLSHWEVTVVSSNFVSLQMILTMSLAIHIVSRYREELRARPAADNHSLVLAAARGTFMPSLYCNLTTMAGFSSLALCDILPVMHFGYMMTMGLGVSMLVVFWLMPAAMMFFPKPPVDGEGEAGLPVTGFFARQVARRRPLIYACGLALALATVAGTLRLTVENSFINYFKRSTEIYRGMRFIDEEFGGTTPLDVIVSLKPEAAAPKPPPPPPADDDFAMFGEFEEREKDPSKYWYTAARLDAIVRVHDYLNSLPQTGKVLSLATLYKTAQSLNEGKPFDDFSLALLYNTASERFKGLLVDPYVSIEADEARFTMRIRDSMPGLRRDALIKQLRRELVEKAGLKEGQFRVSGIMLLYNNMLQSLYTSQIKTIGYTVLLLMLMFLALFRSLRVTLAAIVPQMLASMSILGVMGLAGVPLDMMTITIVSISVGIAVDDTIHYVYRFREEFPKDRDYAAAAARCLGTVGNAMLYTSVAITIGFSILALSNFVPTILFGLLSGLAMVAACVMAQSLLPSLIILLKPFGREP